MERVFGWGCNLLGDNPDVLSRGVGVLIEGLYGEGILMGMGNSGSLRSWRFLLSGGQWLQGGMGG